MVPGVLTACPLLLVAAAGGFVAYVVLANLMAATGPREPFAAPRRKDKAPPSAEEERAVIDTYQGVLERLPSPRELHRHAGVTPPAKLRRLLEASDEHRRLRTLQSDAAWAEAAGRPTARQVDLAVDGAFREAYGRAPTAEEAAFVRSRFVDDLELDEAALRRLLAGLRSAEKRATVSRQGAAGGPSWDRRRPSQA